MTDKELIRQLWDYGHFFNPKYPETQTVKESDLDSLAIDDPRVVQAIESFKEFMCPAGMETAAVDVKELAAEPRCACPDFSPPNAAVGSGSWPEPCQKKAVTISYDLTGCPYAEWWDEILDDVIAAYRAKGLAYTRAPVGTRGNVHITFPVLAGSTIGLAEFNNESCSDRVFCKLDPGYRPNKKQIKALLCHELGHCDNLNHQNRGSDEGHGGVMHPAIQEVEEWKGWDTYGNDPSVPVLRRHHGGEPLDPVTPPPPPGPVAPVVIAEFNITSPGTYQLVKKGSGTPPRPTPT